MKERRGLESARSVDRVRRRELAGRLAARVVNSEGASGGLIDSTGTLPSPAASVAAAAASASLRAFCLRLCGRSCVMYEMGAVLSRGFASLGGSAEESIAAELTAFPPPMFREAPRALLSKK